MTPENFDNIDLVEALEKTLDEIRRTTAVYHHQRITGIVEKHIRPIIQERIGTSERLMTVSDAIQFLDITKSHMYKLTSGRKIPHYKPYGKRVYFLRSELLAFVKKSRIATE